MTIPRWFPLAGVGKVHERAREEGAAAAAELRRRTDGIRMANALPGDKAVALVRGIRARALRHQMPDSTPAIRAERDAG